MLLLCRLCLVLIPQFRRLILIVPPQILSPRAKDPLLGPDAMFVPSNGKIKGPKLVFLDRFLESIRLQFRTTHELPLFRCHSRVKRLLVLGNNQVKSPFFGPCVPEFVNVSEFMCGIEVDNRERNLSEKCLSKQP